jgi:adenosylmethionine-8-amino-7-oxononanoate aminotransferase
MQVLSERPGHLLAAEADELRQEALEHVWFHSAMAWEDAVAPGGIDVMAEGKGCYLTDVNGETYLDCTSGLWLAEVGYGRQEIADAMAAQAARLHYTRSSNPTEPTIRLAKRLAELTPGSLSKVFFVTSGSEANETAFKMALQYHYLNGDKKRFKIIGRRQSYHGGTLGTMAVGGSRLIDRTLFEPLMGTALHIPGPYQYNCDYCSREPSCNLTCAYELERAIQFEGPETIAAFIGEPISNSSGVSIPNAEYWPTIREICDKYGVLLISDEVINGFGRTGKMFAIEHWGIVPDILTVAKGLTSGYCPMGATIAKAEIFEKFKPGPKEAFQHVVTFGGHPVACAAALANLDIIEREGLVENAAARGQQLLDGLRTFHGHPSVGDTRGLGLLAVVQLVKDKKTRAGFSPTERKTLSRSLTQKFNAAKVLLNAGDKIAIVPPLIIDASEIDRVLETIDRALSELESEQPYWS